MSYEEYVNEEAMELTEETPAEECAPTEETAPVEELSLVEETLVDESLVCESLVDESLTVENDLTDAFEIEYSVEEPLTVPTVDEDLFEIPEEEFGFEIEEEPAVASPVDPLQAKCDEIRAVCRDTVSRVVSDLKATNYNPYIRSTTTYRYEIMKKSTDEEPIDVFEFQRTSGFSLRAMAITTALVAAADLAVGKFIKKKLKK